MSVFLQCLADICQVWCTRGFSSTFKYLPVARVTKVANATTETELRGINIAAIIGDRFPVIAKLIPMILYRNEIRKLSFTMLIEVLVKRINAASF